MIKYIKEYGVTQNDYEYILHNARMDVLEIMALSEPTMREVLEYYNSLGLRDSIAKIILYRPDLIIISKENLQDLLSKIDTKAFINIVENAIEDLIILGI